MIFLLRVVLELPSGPSCRAAIQILILHHLTMLQQKKYIGTKIHSQLSEPEVAAGVILGHYQQVMCVGWTMCLRCRSLTRRRSLL